VTDIDTRLLRSFLSVAAEGSFSRAAERLGCSQGTMSLRIRTLEDLLGAQLFERGYHQVELSPSGQRLVAQAQALVDSHDALVDRMKQGDVAGSVRLGVAEDYAQPFLPGLLRRVGQAFPRIELAITGALSIRLSQQVEARSLDLAIVTLPRGERRATVLSEPELLWVAADDFRPPVGQPWPIAFYPEGCAFRAAAIEALARAAIRWREALTSSSGQVIQGAVGSGTAVSVMAEGTIPAGLRRLGPESGLPPLPRTCIQIIERDGGLSVAARQVRDVILRLL
jgi:DNA-binding transcriptional LysR family regulator